MQHRFLPEEKTTFTVSCNCPYCAAKIDCRTSDVKAGKALVCPECHASFPLCMRELKQMLVSLEQLML